MRIDGWAAVRQVALHIVDACRHLVRVEGKDLKMHDARTQDPRIELSPGEVIGNDRLVLVECLRERPYVFREHVAAIAACDSPLALDQSERLLGRRLQLDL